MCVFECVYACVCERERKSERDKAKEDTVPLRAKNEEMKRGFGLVSGRGGGDNSLLHNRMKQPPSFVM